MKYIVREINKDGGTEFDNPDDAILSAANWYFQTGIMCEIYMRRQFDLRQTSMTLIEKGFKGVEKDGQAFLELHSVPHTMAAKELAETGHISYQAPNLYAP